MYEYAHITPVTTVERTLVTGDLFPFLKTGSYLLVFPFKKQALGPRRKRHAHPRPLSSKCALPLA